MAIIWLRNSITRRKRWHLQVYYIHRMPLIYSYYFMLIYFTKLLVFEMSEWIQIHNQTNLYLRQIIWAMWKLHDNVCRAWNWNNKTPIFWKFLGILKPWWWFNEFIMSYKALYCFIVLLENQMKSITLPDTKGLESQRGE